MLLLAILAIVIALGFVVFFGAPYVPSRRKYLRRAFSKLYRPTENDVLLDLGSGDGVVLREAVRAGVGEAIGFELNPLLVGVANWLSRGDDRVKSRVANLWREPFPDNVTIVYLFGDARDIKKMAARIVGESSRLNRTICVVSHGFELPGMTAAKSFEAYFMYEVGPLHREKP